MTWLHTCPHCQNGFRDAAERDAHVPHCSFRTKPWPEQLRIFRHRAWQGLREDDKGGA